MDERDSARPELGHASIEDAFRAYYTRLCDFVEGYVRSVEVARDLVQDLFVHLWERADAGDPVPLTSAYLHKAARNRALKYLRHRRVVARHVERESVGPVPQGQRADARVRRRETAEAIREAIDALPERCRQIFLMSREEDKTYAAIAEELGLSIKTVETQMWRALKALRERLGPFMG